jgi:hypothetical protein
LVLQARGQVLVAARLVAASFILAETSLSIAANLVISVDALTCATLKECRTCTRSEASGYHGNFSISEGKSGRQIDGRWEVGVGSALLNSSQGCGEDLFAASVISVLLSRRLASDAMNIRAARARHVN